MLTMERNKVTFFDDIANYSKDGKLTEPSDGKRYEWRKMIELVKQLGRPLTDTEAEQFRIKQVFSSIRNKGCLIFGMGKELEEIRVSNIKGVCGQIKGKTEELLFSTIRLLPECMIPKGVLEWMSRYIDKRTSQIRQEQVKANWKKTELQNVVEKLHRGQHL